MSLPLPKIALRSRRAHRFVALRALTITIASIALAACATAPQPVAVVAPPIALHVQGVPPLPQSLFNATQPYNDVAGHAFADWHPLRREMLVTHRPPGASTMQLYRVRAPLVPPEALTSGADPVTSARWEPRTGRFVVFARARGGDEAYQLFRLDPETLATTQITADGERHALAGWIKSMSLAIVTSVPLDRTATHGKRSEVATTLALIDPMQPQARRVVAVLPGGGWGGVEVAPDERHLAVTRYHSANESEVWLIELASGQRRRLLPRSNEALRATHYASGWSADGSALFVASDRAGEFRELMRLDVASGALKQLSADTPWDTRLADTSPDGRTLALMSNVDGRGELRLIDSTSGASRPLPALPGGSITQASYHPASGDLALVVNSTRGPSQVHSVAAHGGQVEAWTQPAGSAGLGLESLPEQRIVRWASFDGRQISGVLSLPPPQFTGRRPVVLLMHGGPEGQARQGWQGRWNYLIRERGVAVLEPNVRGSSGYGKTFLALDNGRLREDSVKDMASALDWVAGQPGLDASRVLVMGGSYGGYMALAASVHLGHRIAGAMSGVGISNFVSFLENTETYRRDLRRVEYGDERDPAMRAFLLDISPLTHADRITQPLLVVQGRNDPRVPWTESEQIVRNLQARSRPVWYLLADNEGHGFARRENADYYFAALVRFVEVTLGL